MADFVLINSFKENMSDYSFLSIIEKFGYLLDDLGIWLKQFLASLVVICEANLDDVGIVDVEKIVESKLKLKYGSLDNVSKEEIVDEVVYLKNEYFKMINESLDEIKLIFDNYITNILYNDKVDLKETVNKSLDVIFKDLMFDNPNDIAILFVLNTITGYSDVKKQIISIFKIIYRKDV